VLPKARPPIWTAARLCVLGGSNDGWTRFSF
jgi:hypothetical protein